MPKATHFPRLLPGDQVGVIGESRFSKAIRWCEQFLPDKWRRGPPRFSHIAVVYRPHILIEAVGRIRLAPLSEYENSRVVVYRRKGLEDWQRKMYADAMLEDWDQRYGWGKIVLLLLDALFGTYWFTQRFGVTSYRVCSEYAAYWWKQVFGDDLVEDTDWKDVSPQLEIDYISNRPDLWEFVLDATT